VFALSVIVTALVMFVFTDMRYHILHIAHEALSTLTFLLIALYLRKSAVIASLVTIKELRSRFEPDETLTEGASVTVNPNSVVRCDGIVLSGTTRIDESPLSGIRELVSKSPGDMIYRGSINHDGEVELRVTASLMLVSDAVQTNSRRAAFNLCAGALAKSGIFVKDEHTFNALADAKTLNIIGNSPEREGYAVTKETLAKMGITLSDNNVGDLKIVLCGFRDFNVAADIAITHNKVTHILKAAYIAKVYMRDRWYRAIAGIVFLLAALALIFFHQVMFAGMAVALWSVLGVLDIRRLDRKTDKLSFEKVSGKI
jgi:hypothetical protein